MALAEAVALGTGDEPDDDIPSTVRVGMTSALSVIAGVAVFALGLIAMVLVGTVVGLLILLGALPLWGWACVQNRTLYS
jgi:hypothetical protein